MQIPLDLLNKIGIALEGLVAVGTALFVAFWIGLVIWTFRDIRSRTRDVFAWLLAVILVLIGGPIGWLLYFLLRPRETLAEVYDRQLEEEALLRDITTRRACPSCRTVTEPDWLVCPHCRTELRRTCRECGRALELDWVLCPYCTTAVEKAAWTSKQPERESAQPVPTFQPVAVSPLVAEEPEPEPVASSVPEPAAR